MRCGDVDRLASAYIDGELDDARASALRGHLRTCAACMDKVEDFAAMVRAADDLGWIEPPPALWEQVARGLAEAEVADARRSRLWLWWQGARPHLLPATVAMAGAAALALWLVRGSPAAVHYQHARQAPDGVGTVVATQAPAADLAPAADQVLGPVEAFEDRRAREVTEADARYRGAIEELTAIVAEVKPGWSDHARRAFDQRMADLEAAARRHRQGLAVAPRGPIPDVDRDARQRSRDALEAIYQAQIQLLQAAAIEDDGAGPLSMMAAPARAGETARGEVTQ